MMRLAFFLVPVLSAAQTCNDAVLAAQSACLSLDYNHPAEKCTSGPCNWALANMQTTCSGYSDATAAAWSQIATSLLTQLCTPCAQALFGAASSQCNGVSGCGASCQPLICNVTSACAATTDISVTYYAAASYTVATIAHNASDIANIVAGYKAALGHCPCGSAPLSASALSCAAAYSAANASCATLDASVMPEKCLAGACRTALSAVASSCSNSSDATQLSLQTLATSLTGNLCSSCSWAVFQATASSACNAGTTASVSTTAITASAGTASAPGVIRNGSGAATNMTSDDASTSQALNGTISSGGGSNGSSSGSTSIAGASSSAGICTAQCKQLMCNVVSSCSSYFTTSAAPVAATNTTLAAAAESIKSNGSEASNSSRRLLNDASAALSALGPQLAACSCVATTTTTTTTVPLTTCSAATTAAQTVCRSLDDTFPAEKCKPGPCQAALAAINRTCSNSSSEQTAWRTTANSLLSGLCSPCAFALAQASSQPLCRVTSTEISVPCSSVCEPLLLAVVTNCGPASVVNVTYLSQGQLVNNYLNQESITSISSVAAVRWANCLPAVNYTSGGGENAGGSVLRGSSSDGMCSSAFTNAQQTCLTLDATNVEEKCVNGPCRMALGMLVLACADASTPLEASYSELANSLFTNLCTPCSQSLTAFFAASSSCSQANVCSSTTCSSLSCGVIDRCNAGSSYNITVMTGTGLKTTSFSDSQVQTMIVAPLSSAVSSCRCSGPSPTVYVGSPIPAVLSGLNITKSNAQGTLGVISRAKSPIAGSWVHTVAFGALLAVCQLNY